MKEGIYRQMRLILIYDLPMVEDVERRDYNVFHRKLKKLGFYMIQYSVYTKVLQNDTKLTQIENKLNYIIPKRGKVIIFKLTEKQYLDIKYLRGDKNLYETIVGGNDLVIFKGGDDN